MKQIRLAIITFVLCTVTANFIAAQNGETSNVSFTVDSTKVEITYNLLGDVTKEYYITAVMKSKLDSGAEYQLTSTEGDIGSGKSIGEGKKIVWYYTQDISVKPNIDEFYFDITASPITQNNPRNNNNTNNSNNTKSNTGGSSTWYYWVGGAVVTVVVLVLTVFNGGKDDDNGDDIPSPPTRP
ncbi:MAG: hypothetical protein V1773_18800 [bacterium]